MSSVMKIVLATLIFLLTSSDMKLNASEFSGIDSSVLLHIYSMPHCVIRYCIITCTIHLYRVIDIYLIINFFCKIAIGLADDLQVYKWKVFMCAQ